MVEEGWFQCANNRARAALKCSDGFFVILHAKHDMIDRRRYCEGKDTELERMCCAEFS